MQIIIDAATGEHQSVEPGGGVVGFFSWKRLAEILHDAGEVKPDERLISYRLDAGGVHYRVAREPQ
jgi:hypothetical protein